MRRWTGSWLFQVMTCRLLGAKPLPALMLAYCQLDPWEQIPVKFESEFYHFNSRKLIWKCHLLKWYWAKLHVLTAPQKSCCDIVTPRLASLWCDNALWVNAYYNSLVAARIHTVYTVYPKKYAHGFCFAVLCCGYTLTDFPISIRLTSLALWQSNDCPSASKATLMNMDKYFMWIHYERLHNHSKAKHNKTVCIFLGIYCTYSISIHHLLKSKKMVLLSNEYCLGHRLK